MKNKSKELTFAIHLAKNAAKILVKKQNTAKIKKRKQLGDFALDADYESEKYIVNEINKKYPDHNIFAEESGNHHKKSEYVWVIDPLDGTLNYSYHTPLFAVSIALLKNKEPILAVVYAPILKELYFAEKGKGSWLNGKKIHVNKDTIKNCRILGSSKSLAPIRNKVSYHFLRNFGSSSIDYCYIAAGKASARIRIPLDPYGDPISLLVTEAEGKVTEAKGKPWQFNKSKTLVASNGKIHNDLLKLIK
ncbi:hypothetical protein COV18_07060 [Candidatus Woesearchaeota archaeon CG10_big_fil_rev_8_21_14_0_10_37_12]|nr:MAG: hypothetical protein COV18_07060 [Candidatus Woesearchaeota archaeon CG10_big_fil_rev_8_21_14_0_10_37_12]